MKTLEKIRSLLSRVRTQPQQLKVHDNLIEFMNLLEASKHYICIKKALLEFRRRETCITITFCPAQNTLRKPNNKMHITHEQTQANTRKLPDGETTFPLLFS